MGKVIGIGAEAKLYTAKHLGDEALVKERVGKGYRHKKLDERLRRTRTNKEANLLHRVKALGVKTPLVFDVDKKKAAIVMEYVDGPKLKDVLNQRNLHYCFALGEAIGKMHRQDIIHGDLTTSNVLVKKGELIFIDFGLGFQSKKLEDKAMDLLVLKKTFMATHFQLEKGWQEILKGYLSETKNKGMKAAIERIEKRARYH